ncbi:histone-lysine N-methyltransferase SETDB2-like isoform X3 [Neophocaena asiaeorientalis asiaeorientalis]|uniref:Histone-lysine N-methyltransferase SETDB2 n=1 Tax=Neophocaena asiaeorientalis asiaeorientalis TaxID=1706337 RepID=A0A341C8H3_NEOAA|nr:histone-lysine N-methyltransferase SETDB2-like isoform X3 [Neophocaena asiaeorientalis asiaeorientalis]
MGEKNGDAKTFWMELEDDGKVDFIFEQVQNVLQSLKQKIKDGSATNKEYIQAMILVKEATINNNSTLIKDHTSVTQNAQENKSSSLPSTSHEDSFPEDYTPLSTENKEIPPLENKVADFREKESSSNLSYQKHDCSSACLMKMPLTFKGENPLQLPIKCHFQRRHAKTNSHSSALHVSYKTPCGRSLRNMEEVFRYLLETECNFLFTDNFSFNTYVQLTRNYPRQEEIVSDTDISNGVESVPISFCNEIDNRKLPHFKYRKTMWPRAYYLNSFSNMFTDSCDCSEGCIDITKCACLQLTARNAKTCPLLSSKITTGYKYKRLQRQIPTGIYECSLLCKCNRRMCQNRVVQHGPQVRLQVFKTEKKGWGVRCLDDIDRGTFVCIYSGRLLSRSNTENPDAIDENGKEENIMKNMFSKKRKIEVADCEVEVIPLELETYPRSAVTEECPPKLHNNPKEPIIEMKCNSISRIQYHSVIRSPKTKTASIQHNGKKMGFTSSESVTSEDNGGFKPTQVHLNSKAKEMRGVFQVAERLQKRICALCPKDLECSVLYFAQSENIAAHENCLLYSSALVECEDHDPFNHDRNFDVESVKKEVKRGRKLKCTFCGKAGATVGCDLKSCLKNYHFFCAKSDHAVLQADGSKGTYRVLCQQHADLQNDLLSVKPLSGVLHSHYSQRTEPKHGVKSKRGRKKHLSTGNLIQDPNVEQYTKTAAAVKNATECSHVIYDRKRKATTQTSRDRFVKVVKRTESSKEPEPVPSPSGPPERMALDRKEKDGRYTDAIVKVPFLKKCKEAGLLNALFEEIVDKLHLIQERLRDENTSESDYEEIGTSLFDCRLFEDAFVNIQAAIENKIHLSEQRQQQLKDEIELLQGLKQTLCSELQSSSTSDSSLSS